MRIFCRAGCAPNAKSQQGSQRIFLLQPPSLALNVIRVAQAMLHESDRYTIGITNNHKFICIVHTSASPVSAPTKKSIRSFDPQF